MTSGRRDVVAAAVGGALRGHVGGTGGERVLALHGGPGLSFDYLDAMVDELRTGYVVASYKQRGLAPSTTEGPFSVAREVADAVAVLDALEWDRAWVVGHSWGGHLLLHLAAAHPERLRGGLAVDPLGAVGDGGMAVMGARLQHWLETRGDTEAPGAVSELENLRRVWPAYFADPDTAPPMPDIGLCEESLAGVLASAVEEMPALATRLGSVPCEIGFVAGGASPLPVAASVDTAGVLPRAWVEVVDGAGHLPWIEAPGSVLAGLDRLTGRVA
ncbi:MAG: alpha/beta fold hydrolase [Acidimicrobiales bacterium]